MASYDGVHLQLSQMLQRWSCGFMLIADNVYLLTDNQMIDHTL